ncbi:Fructosamine kinase-domain-containing protein [Coniochaeta sp. 2T2.1]|nr:Fructosamine kinase-domain-containing protein [Coniochaeta sp. 2T2.1]
MAPTDPKIWNKPIPVPIETISYIDSAVIGKLPPGNKVLSITESGLSYWARTAKISTIDEDGNEDNYFIKVHQGPSGKDMVSSESASMTTVYTLAPDLVAKPLGWGTYTSMPDTHFILCAYHKFTSSIPSESVFPKLVADLHKRSAIPGGKFGNPNVTFGGRNPQLFPVSDTWEECFTRGMQGIFEAEKKTHGEDEELDYLEQAMLEVVFPRLIRALEGEVVPCLVHGDLWEGNAAVDATTGKPVIFDATPLYAHNEYELGAWLPQRHKFWPYIAEYKKHSKASEPREEFDDRVEMYCLRFDMHASSLYPGNLRFRNIGKNTMRMLLEKYGDGYPPFSFSPPNS